MERGQTQLKGGMVSTNQVLQVPQGGKQVMKGVHAYDENLFFLNIYFILIRR